MSRSKSDLVASHIPRSRRMANRRTAKQTQDTGLADYHAVEDRLRDAERRYYGAELDLFYPRDLRVSQSARLDDHDAAALEMAAAVDEIMAVQGISLSAVKKKLGWLGKEDRLENLAAFAESYRDMKRMSTRAFGESYRDMKRMSTRALARRR